jgi:hypothetical protein
MGGSLGGSIPVCSTCYDFRIEGTSKLVFGNEKTTSCPYIANTASSGTTAKLYGTW